MNATTDTAATFAGHTADEWAAQAQRSRQASADSWERSDTDGFLSQWASDQMAVRYNRLAEVARHGGRESMAVLLDLEGQIIRGRWVDGQYGTSYRTADGRWLRPSEAKAEATRTRNNAAKGIGAEVNAWVPVALDRRTFLTYVDLDAPADRWELVAD